MKQKHLEAAWFLPLKEGISGREVKTGQRAGSAKRAAEFWKSLITDKTRTQRLRSQQTLWARKYYQIELTTGSQ